MTKLKASALFVVIAMSLSGCIGSSTSTSNALPGEAPFVMPTN